MNLNNYNKKHQLRKSQNIKVQLQKDITLRTSGQEFLQPRGLDNKGLLTFSDKSRFWHH